MLLFIQLDSLALVFHPGFNTSHVTLYRARGFKGKNGKARFNTSHVTLYRKQPCVDSGRNKSFNTSHVTLYREKDKCKPDMDTMFQYISCYSLSSVFWPDSRKGKSVSIHLMLLFIGGNTEPKIAIPVCFNTSHVTLYQVIERLQKDGYVRFNTSHVTLYRIIGRGERKYNRCFNTSHVTLYRICPLNRHIPVWVSIHLMLLFIFKAV